MITSQLSAATLKDIAGRFSDPEFLARGCVQTISVEAVRERLGSRWPLRQDQVSEFVVRQVQKHFSPSDLLTQINETEFLLLQPTAERFGAEVRAIGLLREVMTFFLGKCDTADLKVGTVQSIGPDGVTHILLSLGQLETHLVGLDRPQPEADGPSEAAQEPSFTANPVDHEPSRRQAVLQSAGEYRVKFSTDPIWAAQKNAIVSHALNATVSPNNPDAAETLDEPRLKDRIGIDVFVLTEAMRMLREGPDGARFGLHVPVHQATLLSQGGRQAVLWRLHELGDLAGRLVLNIRGFEAGAPAYRISDAVGPFHEKCLAVCVEAPSLATDVSTWRGAHLSAVSLDFRHAVIEGGDIQRQLRTFAEKARLVAPGLVAYGLPSRSRMLTAWAEGFTHLSGAKLHVQTRGSLTPIRYTPVDLYSGAA